ncbi:acetate--CoA ligase [Rhizobium ruizarguesonis]|uniref:acetate--CoA ligase n=1 Tax=Rhizobium ruizarguesonis TaxID=2081791 RepID=UPI00103073C6|nr:acetate--CoA ligase [Rhizobium ruizarguesonis]TBC88668.1 acetate--CoA ligase [Rhizobium ruizarguesonis]TBD07753.1 acetate--CoA ligase [Rhizobium ruizarguesonis]TBD24686.1 acetate--CoA ligase [Rhizobium ruizarguesonis]TBD24929.1 acetate--CoA ligase [Rhizobium ruizarguesonis]TBD50497.1 acetate--CoA ligase [Rhizobium ruizarguesonis]
MKGNKKAACVYPVPKEWAERAFINAQRYEAMYAASIANPEEFWREHGKRIHWFRPYSTVKNTSFEPGEVSIKWYQDGTTNASYNCVDRHLAERGDQVATIWVGDHPKDGARSITYRELHAIVMKWANVLKSLGVRKGDVVTLYLPTVPEATYAMLACARIGAIHSALSTSLPPKVLASRIADAGSKVVVTGDQGLRGGQKLELKATVDAALDKLPEVVTSVIVVRRTGAPVGMLKGRDHYYDELAETVPDECRPEEMKAEDPLFILFTSGSTAKPKGVVHTTGGYLVYAAMTHQYVFDYHEGDICWCTAEINWITGHSYTVYGPLANGATTLMFEGIPTYPNVSRYWEIIDKHKVSLFYTAPTVIRSLMRSGEGAVKSYSRASLRLLGSVGEPIDPKSWEWYHRVVGDGRCPIVDTWWQTETGGILITPLPGATDLKPGSASKPFFGVKPEIVDAAGNVLDGVADGNLVIADSWPGQGRTLYRDPERFEQEYFSPYPGKYFTRDGARRDADGDYSMTGRVDDVINVSGHRIGTAEVEAALVAHASVSEAAVVGYPHEIKGQGIYAYVILIEDDAASDDLRKELVSWVRREKGPTFTIDKVQFALGLPKTSSGKIIRRILGKIAEDDFTALGDTSTLADPSVLEHLIDNRLNRNDGDDRTR